MKIAGNFWQETWDSARAIPATQQQRLFNETREVEQILQYFANISAECWDLIEPKFEKLFNDLNMTTKTGDMDAYFDVSHSLRTSLREARAPAGGPSVQDQIEMNCRQRQQM
ncbi:hypothetical protein niasHS_015534 [Heterodera schachtii]|uniref:Rab3 GTPase-activating protein catalytic subunit n=1 Tax=Heterodera schachtii TaxID=97005 RepID=A0ABD2HTP6_HETSC